jgi:catechol 2,3-dioxygenase-like lactoylglutathione lyase family enzyme
VVGDGTMALALGHAGLSVSDMDRSLGFYEDGLGLRCVARRHVEEDYIRRIVQVPGTTGIEVAFLAAADGAPAVELLCYRGAPAAEVSPVPPSAPGTGHLCLLVTDAAVALERALGAGGTARTPRPVEIASGPYRGGWGCYLEDPDGYLVELLQAPVPDPDAETEGNDE